MMHIKHTHSVEFSLENSGYLVYVVFKKSILLETKGKTKLNTFIWLARYKYLSQRTLASYVVCCLVPSNKRITAD